MKINGLGWLLFLLLLVGHVKQSQGQVIISLLLGDKLNSGQIEFGLDGGVNFNSQPGTGGGSATSFNLGFYFDIKTKNENWMFHTGVIVKSTMGGGIPLYSLGDPTLDGQFAGGTVERALQYFNVPFMMKRKFKNHFFLEAGPMLGLLYNGKDHFRNTVNGQTLTYEVDVQDQLRALDAGLTAGIGYRLMKGNGMNIGVRYYWGLVDITKNDQQSVMNNSLYCTIGIPIGAGKAREREEKSGKN